MQIQSMTGQQLTEAKDPDTGGSVAFGSNPKSVVEAIYSAVTMDWAWLYDVDPVSGEQTPNSFYIIWAVIYWPIMVAIVFELMVLIFRILRGGGV